MNYYYLLLLFTSSNTSANKVFKIKLEMSLHRPPPFLLSHKIKKIQTVGWTDNDKSTWPRRRVGA